MKRLWLRRLVCASEVGAANRNFMSSVLSKAGRGRSQGAPTGARPPGVQAGRQLSPVWRKRAHTNSELPRRVEEGWPWVTRQRIRASKRTSCDVASSQVFLPICNWRSFTPEDDSVPSAQHDWCSYSARFRASGPRQRCEPTAGLPGQVSRLPFGLSTRRATLPPSACVLVSSRCLQAGAPLPPPPHVTPAAVAPCPRPPSSLPTPQLPRAPSTTLCSPARTTLPPTPPAPTSSPAPLSSHYSPAPSAASAPQSRPTLPSPRPSPCSSSSVPVPASSTFASQSAPLPLPISLFGPSMAWSCAPRYRKYSRR